MSEVNEGGIKYWQYEYDVMAKYLIPLLKAWGVKLEGSSVLDMGCGDAGGISAMADAGMICKGFDQQEWYIGVGRHMMGDRKIELCVGDIYADPRPFAGQRFDLVVLHDVFEHIERKAEVLEILKSYLAIGGKVMMTFPPYYSTFGAHQQFLKSRFGRMPFFHLFPGGLSIILPRLQREEKHLVDEIQKLSRLKMGIRKFEALANGAGYGVVAQKFYIVGPNHIRFGLTPLSGDFLAGVPFFRELLVSGVVYLLELRG